VALDPSFRLFFRQNTSSEYPQYSYTKLKSEPFDSRSV